jgi:Dehydrogenases with different specificities (related to short-chain alcohol dehydrogenases)
MTKEKLIKKQPFKGKTAIVCGGSKGIGKATAKEIFRLGGNVCIIARNLDALRKAAEEMKSLKVDDTKFVEIFWYYGIRYLCSYQIRDCRIDRSSTPRVKTL